MSDEELIRMLQKQFEMRNNKVADLRQVMLELEVVNRRLRESEALKGRFLSNIRNEINNPLAVIIGAAFNQMHSVDLDQSRPLAKLIYKEAQNLNFQMENIFVAAEMEAGSNPLAVAQVDVESVVNSILDTFRLMAEDKQLELNLTLHDEGPFGKNQFFCTDEAKLQLVIANLIHNAIKFSGEGQTITISFHYNPEDLELCVRDEGIGISEEHFDQIYDRFRQLDEGRCKEYQGHGLGLSLVKAVLDELGGTISLESTPGAGSAFSIRVPHMESEGGVQDVGVDGNEIFFDDDDGEMETF